MARTTVSNVEFMARAKTRCKPRESFEAAATRSIGPTVSSTELTPEHDAPTGTLGIGDRLAPQVHEIPPITMIPAAEGGKAKRKNKSKGSPSSGRLPKSGKRGQASRSLSSTFLGSDVRSGEDVSYHLESRVKDMLKDVSEDEVVRTIWELSLKLSVMCTKFPKVDRSMVDALEKEFAAARVELQEVKSSASDLKTKFNRLNVVKAEHSKCVNQLKEADDWLKEEHQRTKAAAEELDYSMP